MSTKTIKLYNVLVDLKVDRALAEEAIEPILTREEAFQTLVTKDDLQKLTRWMAAMFIGQFVGMVGVIIGLFNFFLS